MTITFGTAFQLFHVGAAFIKGMTAALKTQDTAQLFGLKRARPTAKR